MRRDGWSGTLLSRSSAETDAGCTRKLRARVRRKRVKSLIGSISCRICGSRLMSLSGRATGRALLPDKGIGSAQIDPIQDDPHVDATHRRRVRHAHQQSRQAVFDTVHALNKQDLSYSEIARRTGRLSIAKWLTFETPPDRQKAALKPTSPLYFEAFLAQCWRDGNRCGRHLLYDIKQRGYTGSFSNLERLLASSRRPERSVKDSASPAPIISYQPGRDAVPIRDP